MVITINRAFGTPKLLECNPHSNPKLAGVVDCTPDWHSGLDWHSAFPSKIGRSFGLLHSTECHSKCPADADVLGDNFDSK